MVEEEFCYWITVVKVSNGALRLSSGFFRIFQYQKFYLWRYKACIRQEAWLISSPIHFPLHVKWDWVTVWALYKAFFRKEKKGRVSLSSWFLWGLYHRIYREKSCCLFSLQTCCLMLAVSEFSLITLWDMYKPGLLGSSQTMTLYLLFPEGPLGVSYQPLKRNCKKTHLI